MGILRKVVRQKIAGRMCGVCHVKVAPGEEQAIIDGGIMHSRCSRQTKVPEGFLPTVYTLHTAVGIVPARCWLNDADRSALWNQVYAITASLKTMFIKSEQPTIAEAVTAVRSLYAALSKFVRLLPAINDIEMNAGRMVVVDAMRKLHEESMKHLGTELVLTKPMRDLRERHRRHRVEGTKHIEARLALLWANAQPI
jgi:hypothetical protein